MLSRWRGWNDGNRNRFCRRLRHDGNWLVTRLHLATLAIICGVWALAVFAGVELRVRVGRLVNRLASAVLPHWSRIWDPGA
jgi:hypothetical protein